MTERNAEKTRQRILAAALAEFSDKGFAGGRVDSIARRARINKRMLYHYFGDKVGLYEAILAEKMCKRRELEKSAPLPPAEAMPLFDDEMGEDPSWIRLMEWEALETFGGKVIGETERTEAMARMVAATRRSQDLGLLPGGLDPAQLQMSILAIIVFPRAFPQAARMMTGLLPSDPEFRRKRRIFLGAFGAILGAAAAAGTGKPVAAVKGIRSEKTRSTARPAPARKARASR